MAEAAVASAAAAAAASAAAAARSDGGGAYTYEGVDQKLVRRAEKELNERPAQISAHIASLRRWLVSMPHIKCRSDDRFLLRFLRTAKFDQSRAQILLDNYVTIRKSPKGTPHWFDYQPIDSPEIEEYLKHPFHVFLGHTTDGEGIYMSSMKYWDVEKMNFDQLIRCIYMSVDAVQQDQCSQISGIKVLLDMGQAEKKQLSFFENRKNFFALMRNWQDAFPVRIRAVVYINEPLFFDVIFALMKSAPFLKEKFKKKLHKVGKDYDRLRKILGPEDAARLLPKEFGGRNGTLAERVQWTRDNFHSERMGNEWRMMREGMDIDETKRLPATKDYLKTDDSAADPTTGIRGTFTKLNVD